MSGPTWARWLFALLCVGSAVCCAANLWQHRASIDSQRPTNDHTAVWAHLLMSVGMAVMFAPLASPFPPMCWAVLFTIHAGWLLARLARRGSGPAHRLGAHPGLHLVADLVMAAMFATMPADGLSGTGESHAGHLTASSPVLAVAGWTALAYFLGRCAVAGVRVAIPPRQVDPPCCSRDDTRPAGARLLTSARLDTPLHLVMGVGMSYMLLTVL